ncbi:MAG: PD-(D/E)XK nuclease family transposase [Treponemataceae bacterium]|nr:PD-(D/E)XK nuclease family transposase [Treponemataceae bacterium]
MENKELTMEIDHINMNTQEVISIDWRSKGIRLDVFARNSAQVFDIEIQTTDTGELPERARYYQSAMDCAVRASEHIIATGA